MSLPPLDLIAYAMYDDDPADLVPGEARREWMWNTPSRFANRCLPLLIANQSGWEIRTRNTVTATWKLGLAAFHEIEVETDGGWAPMPHFGSGVLTWHIPWIFRTPPGWNLHIRGPVNQPKDGASPLEGIIEADWMTQSTTFSWQMTRVTHPVTWHAGEAIAVILPQRRDELERFRPRIEPMPDDLDKELVAFSQSRGQFNADTKRGPKDWQGKNRGGYFTGGSPGGSTAPEGEHRTNRKLRPFTR